MADVYLSRAKQMERRADSKEQPVESIQLRIADNKGVIVNVHRKPEPPKKSGRGLGYCGPCYTPPTEHVFESMESAQSFVSECLKGKK